MAPLRGTTERAMATAFYVDGGKDLVDSNPVLMADPGSLSMFYPKVYPRAQEPCDPMGRIKLGKNNDMQVGRDGVYCDNELYPLNNICVTALPRDFCPSVRPKTVYLPPKWSAAFVKEKPVHFSRLFGEGNVKSPNEYSNKIPSMPGVPDPTTMKPTDGRREIIADQGDYVCAARLADDIIPDGQLGKQVANGEDHWGQPWCVGPTALYR